MLGGCGGGGTSNYMSSARRQMGRYPERQSGTTNPSLSKLQDYGWFRRMGNGQSDAGWCGALPPLQKTAALSASSTVSPKSTAHPVGPESSSGRQTERCCGLKFKLKMTERSDFLCQKPSRTGFQTKYAQSALPPSPKIGRREKS